MKTVRIYYRVSTESQEFDQQREQIESYIRSKAYRQEYDIVEYSEKEHGDRHYLKREIANLIKDLKKDDIVICSELSRIARSMVDLQKITSDILDKGCTLIETKTNMCLSNQTENVIVKTFIFVVGMAAEMELDNIRKRTKAGMEAARKKGKKFGAASIDYVANDTVRKREIMGKAREHAAIMKLKNTWDNQENKMFMFICEQCRSKNMKWAEITAVLNEQGLTTPEGTPYVDDKAKLRFSRLIKSKAKFDEAMKLERRRNNIIEEEAL